MDNILDVVEEPGPDVRESNLLQNIWFYPTATFRFVLKHKPNKYVNLLFLLAAFVNSLSRSGSTTFNSDSSNIFSIILQISVATLFGWIIYYVLAWATHQTGKWLGAEGDLLQVRTVLAWSLIPTICILLLILPQIVLLGVDYFSDEKEIGSLPFSVILIVISVLASILMLWSLVLFVRGIMLVHALKAGRAVFNVLLPYFVILIVALVTVPLFYDFQ